MLDTLCVCVSSGAIQEKAVIVKQKARKSLKTPDETVTVNFIPQQSNVKKSFPVTHARLLRDEDLSSPGESEDEEMVARETSSGAERLDLKTFEEFGEDMRRGEGGIRERGEVDERENGEGEREKGNVEGATDGSDKKLRKGEGEETKCEESLPHFEGVDTSISEVSMSSRKRVERAASLGNVKPLELPPLKKWENMQNLKQAEQLGEGERQLNSVLEEDEEENQQTVPEETKPSSSHIQEFGSSAVYYKQPQRVVGGERESAEVKVLKRVNQIEGESRVKVEGVSMRGRSLETVRSGSVSEKLKMFGGGRRVTQSVSESAARKTTASEPATPTREKDENAEDEVAPLPNIDKQLSRRYYEEKLRMDGLPSLSPPQQRAHGGRDSSPTPLPPSSPPLGRLQEVNETTEAEDEVGRVSPAPSPTQYRRKSSIGVYSPLVISADASDNRRRSENLEKKTAQGSRLSQPATPTTSPEVSAGETNENRRSLRDERARRQLFALSVDGKVGSRESAYMGWSSPPPQLGQMRQRWEKEAGEGIKRRVAGLLRSPRMTGSQVPLEFRGLLPGEPGRLSVWRQKVSHDTLLSLSASS